MQIAITFNALDVSLSARSCPLSRHDVPEPFVGLFSVTYLNCTFRLIEGSCLSAPINAFSDPKTSAKTQTQAHFTSIDPHTLIYLNNSTVGDTVIIPSGWSKSLPTGYVLKSWGRWIRCSKTIRLATLTYLKPNAPVHVEKGDELGMFHFDRSTHVGPNVHLKF